MAVAASLSAPVIALAVAAVAVVPMATAIATNVPITTRQVDLPPWFAKAAPRLGADQVVLAYPAPFTLIQSAMAWQAVDLLRFSRSAAAGPVGFPCVPEGTCRFRGDQRCVVLPRGRRRHPVPRTSRRYARLSAGWGVTIVVVPDPQGLPRYDQGTDPAAALGLFAVAIGRAPHFADDAWVWTDVQSPARAS